MKQPIKGDKKKNKKRSGNRGGRIGNSKKHSDYGTSGLERYFAENFLDRNGLRYIYQYHARDIGRYYDFAVTADMTYPYIFESVNGINAIKQDGQPFKIDFMIEVDGDWYHANPEKIDESKLNPMQKHNRMVDRIKDRWCALNGIPLLRIWEHDIRNNPSKVLSMMSKYTQMASKKDRIRTLKKKPH